ncbi:ankyrin repeat-containing domain protein [Baffinella frigidus]|nr:ankyrin repeat-containing domain protein [Cryptophyta sp. CCMP2293]
MGAVGLQLGGWGRFTWLLPLETLKSGVTSGVDMINAKSGDGSTPIFLAAQNDRPNVVDFLLSQNDRPHVVDFFLSQKADPNSSQAGRQAWTPLHIASCHGFRDVLQLLVKHGAALEARLNEHSSDPPRLVPSLPAASKNKASDKHAPPTSHGNPSSKPSGEKWAALHGQAPGQLQRYSSGGATALYVAAERQHLESVELLVASRLVNARVTGHADAEANCPRAKVDAALGNKCTPLFVACDRGNLPIAKVLMDNRANIHAVAENEFTPLLVAAGNNRKGCVQELIRRGADLNAMTTSSRTALFLAVESGHFEVAQLLIRAGAMCNLGLETGESPLFIAVEKGRIDLAKELLGAPHPADPNVVLDYRKYHPLYVATFDNRPDMMTLLIEHKARVDEKIERGFSPIYIAAQMNHPEALEAPALAEVVSANRFDAVARGFSALYIAAQMNHPEALEVLLKAKTEQARAEAVSRGVDTTLVEKVRSDNSGLDYGRPGRA